MARSPMFNSQSGSFQIPVFHGPFPPATSFLPAPPYPLPPLNNSWMTQCMPPVNGVPYFQPPVPPPNQGYNNWRGMRPRGCGRNKQQRWKQNRKQTQESKEGGKDIGDFKCEPCESTFRTQSDLNCHISQHRQCSNPGCHFMAVSRVLKEHELIHTVPKELFFTSDEEIAKWRDERKKKYPTTDRVRLKLQEEDEKLQRGETAKDDVYRYCKRGGAHRQHPAAKRGRGGRGRFQRGSRQNRGGRTPQHSEADINDECSVEQLPNNLTKDTGITQSMRQKTTQPILRSNVKHKATLLEKLLTPEIRKERNTILQCIRHIVKHNFFGIEESNNVDGSHVNVDEQNILVSSDVAEHSVMPETPHTDEQIDNGIIYVDKEDGEIPSDPEPERAVIDK